jgi:radical SAM protein with 4Fe4S-binding SPASM domain
VNDLSPPLEPVAIELAAARLPAAERQRLMAAARPRRSLPLLETLPSRARGSELLAETRAVDRAARPQHAVWELTLRCDLSCRHCGSRAGRARPDELSIAEALDLVAQLAELGVREVTLIGGEAYLYPGWTEVVRAVRAAGMSCALVSGGQGITAALARAASEAGVQSLSISIDGVAATHDRLRGKRGAHARALAALHTARSLGMPVAVNTQINRLNLAELREIADQVLAHGCHGWQMQITVPAGRAADEPEILLQPYDLLVLFPILAELETRLSAAGVKFLPGNNIGYFGPYERRFRGKLRCPSAASCSAGRSLIGIEANGDIKGCPSLPTRGWVGGNLRDHRLRDIWERAPALRYTREHTPERLWGFCGTCYYADECRGGCTWTATTIAGRPGNNPYCHHRALLGESEGWRERIVALEPAPGEPFDVATWQLVREPWPARAGSSTLASEAT